MKEKKAGSAGQILGSIRGPEHWVLISNGFMGDTWGQRGLAQGGQGAAYLPTPPQRGTGTYHEAILAPVPTVEEAVAGLEEEEAALAVEVIGGDAEDAQALPLPQQLLLARVDPMVGRGLATRRRQMPVSAARSPGTWALPGGTYLTWVHARENLLMSSAARSGTGGRSFPVLHGAPALVPASGLPCAPFPWNLQGRQHCPLPHSMETLLDCSSLVPKANPSDASILFTPSSCQKHLIRTHLTPVILSTQVGGRANSRPPDPHTPIPGGSGQLKYCGQGEF